MSDTKPTQPEAAAKKKKKKKKASKGAQWTVRLEKAIAQSWTEIREIAQSLRSHDPATRRMAGFFFVSLIGVVLVLGLGLRRYRTLNRPETPVAVATTENNLGRFLGREAESAKRKGTTFSLGQFTVELKKVPDQPAVHGVLNLAELEIIVECDERETCGSIEESLTQVRNLVTNIFVALDRNELMSREGKRKIKKAIQDRINFWLPRGRLENVYFSKLVIS